MGRVVGQTAFHAAWVAIVRREGSFQTAMRQAARSANQTASQSVQFPTIIRVYPRTSLTPASAFSGVPQITDTEEVTGSNPVSPTSKTPDQGRLAVLTPPPPSRVLVNLLVYGSR